ncbi:DUF1524 domain-containing protein [Streptomyces sp. NPDC051211]|uniref:GmrSD restriction endonuclease domain-containing protein n=1 Tax=Streptomyces sp. NPDC051211 TaxID=3154643 RepID=UPI00344BCC10
MRRQTRLLGCVFVAAVLAVSGCTESADRADGKSAAGAPRPKPMPGTGAGEEAWQPAAGEVLPGMVDVSEARTQLAGLKVAPEGPMTGFGRSRHAHWLGQDQQCDVPEFVLKRDGRGVKRDADCRAVSGTWKSLYDGQVISDPAKLGIDHVVSLAAAWRSGANTWDEAKRKEFANDLARPQLLTVSADSHRAKGDRSPDAWQPPDKASWCTFGRAWTTVKAYYGLTATEAEKTVLTTMLDTCP